MADLTGLNEIVNKNSILNQIKRRFDMESEYGKDPLTGETFIKTRSDKKFANTRNKSKSYYLKIAKPERLKMAPVQKPLLKNRKILNKILEGVQERIVSKDFLLGAGFNFGYYTGTATGGTVFLVYEYEFSIIENKAKIKRKM